MNEIRTTEDEHGYDVHWAFDDPDLAPGGVLPPGLTCVFRVKDEARNLPWVLPPMLRTADRVVLVDNGSTDGTPEVAARVAAEHGAADRYTGLSYPFTVARAGREHRGVPANSVHSLTHFYNWAFSQVRTSYSMKWDGDMVLTPQGEQVLGDLAWRLEGSGAVVQVPRHPLVVVDDSSAWIDLGSRFLEPWVYPMGREYTFVKAFNWEVREIPDSAERLVAPDGTAIEVKWLDSDEFGHWSDPAEFTREQSPRKHREWTVDRAIREGRADQVDHLVRITAPPGVHVIDHVVDTWLPQAPRPLVRGPLTRRSLPSAGGDGRGRGAGGAGGGAPRSRRDGGPAGGQAASRRGGGDPLTGILDTGDERALVLVDPRCDVRHRLPAEGVAVLPLPHAGQVPGGRTWGSVTLVVPDRATLRRAASALPRIGTARRVAVYLEHADQVLGLRPRPEWPRLVGSRCAWDTDGSGTVGLVRFDMPVPAEEVLAEFARQSVPGRPSGHQALRIGTVGGTVAPPGQFGGVRFEDPGTAAAEDLDVPPDVLLAPPGSVEPPEHHVLGRAPVVLGNTAATGLLGPFDERVLNPIGWQREISSPPARLTARDATARLVLHDGRVVALDPDLGVGDSVLDELAGTTAVGLAWPASPSVAFARAVVGLAMGGVPLTSEGPPPGWAGDWLDRELLTVLEAASDLTDPLLREVHSVRVRRAAHRAWAGRGWRRRVSGETGLRVAPDPTVSVVVASKRPEQIEHAVAQVARKRGAPVELVLVPHGYTPDRGRIAEVAGDLPVTVLVQDGDVLFGDALNAGLEATSGELVMKMDDDDWYGPDVVADLLLARDWSGADLVGLGFEFIYLVGHDVTVRRFKPTEAFTTSVAGGSTMLPRALMRELGGFRSARRYVDASLLSDVRAAGGSIYRTQGLGYLFKRGDSGHTWQQDADNFLDPRRRSGRWDGFMANPLMEL